MAQYLPLPDGTSVTIREGETPAQAWARAQQMYPEAFGVATRPKQDTTGFKAAAAAGLERLKGEAALTAGKIGLMDTAAAERYQKEREAAAQARFTPTEKGWTEAPIEKFKETLGGSLPYMALPAAAGLGALAAPVAAPTAALIGAGAAGLTSAAQFTGSNLSRQMGTGKTLEETSLGQAVGAAIPQAALDTAAMALMPGVGKLFNSVGSKLTADQAKAIATQTLGRTVADYTAKTGLAMGREGLTEATQQVLERLQAGLALSDPEARKEYVESFIGGAALAGAGAPVGRAFERSAAKKQAAEDQQQRLREQRRLQAEEDAQAAAAEEARKQSPAYALEIEQQYRTLEQQKKDLQAQIIKATKGEQLSEADKAANTAVTAQLKELQPQLKTAATEFQRTAKIRAEAQEQARLAGMSPEDFMLEQMGLTPQAPAPAPAPVTTIDEMGRIVEAPPAAPAAPEVSAVEQYAQQQIQAARDFGALGIDDYVKFLMQDPTMADQMVKTRTKMPDLSRQDNEAILGALKLQLKEAAKQQAAVAKEGEARAERIQSAMAGQAPGAELLGAMRQQPGVQAAQEARAVEEERAAKVTPEVEALQRIGQRPAGGMDQFDLSGIAPAEKPGVAAPQIPVTRTAPTIKRRVEELYAQRDQAEQDMRMAAAAGERAATEAAIARKEEAQQALARLASEDPESAPYANAFVNLRGKQEKAFMELQDTLDMIKRGAYLGGEATEEGTTTKALLQKQADERRAALINAVLEEAALHRRAQGKPAVGTDEAVKAADEMNSILEEAITRMQSTAQREEVVTSPAQMRGTKLVKGAETEMRDTRPLAERPLRSPLAAFKVFQEQINNIREALINPEQAVTREEPLLRTQFAATEAEKTAEARGEKATTLGGELRRRTEFVRDKMAKMKGMRPAAASVLNDAADLMDAGRATRDLLDAVEPVVDMINRNTMPMQTDLRAIKDAVSAIRKQAQEGETVGKIEGQRELFTERQDREMADRNLGVIRTTAEKFANAPAVKKAQAAIEQAKQAAAAAAKAAEQAGKAEAAKLEKTKERAAEKAVGVEAQRRDLQQAVLDAMAERRDALKAATKAQSPQVLAAQKALDASEKELTALEEQLANLPDSEPKRSASAKVRAQKDAVYAARTNLDKALAEASAEYDGKELVAAAHQDSLVQFERKALEKLEKELAALEKAANPQAVSAAQKEIRAQRGRVAEAENKAREAREVADREKRQLEQRMMSGLGLPGVKRVAGEVVAIKDAKQKALDAERQKARDNLEQAMDSLEGRPNVPQIPRATGPVTRVSKPAPSALRTGTEESKAGETRTVGETGLSEARKPAKSERAITTAEMEAANVEAERMREEARAAQEEADRLRKMTPAQKRKAEKEAKAVEKELAKSRGVYRVTEGGKGVPMAALNRLVTRITEGWKNVPTIVAAANFDALPDKIKAQAEADGVAGNIPGVYDPDTKTVYLVADSLNSAEDVFATVAHEIAGHFGLREMLGGDYAKVMNDAYNGNKAVREKADAKMAGMPSLSREVAVEEVLADMAEADPNAQGKGGLRGVYDAIKRWFRETFKIDKMSDKAVQQIVANARQYVIEGTGGKAGEAPKTAALYRAKTPKYANDELAQAGQIASKVIANQKPFTETIKEEGLGMGLATRLVDRFAPLEKISKLMEPLKGTQMMYYARMFDQKMHFLQQAVSNGAISLEEKTRKDGKKEWLVESKEGASIKGVVDTLKQAKDIVGSADAASQLFSLYTVAKRAERVGLNKMNFSGAVTQSDLDTAMRTIKATPGLEKIFEAARKDYNEFNKGMVNFAVDTGALSKDVAKKMLQSEDYVPFYRMRDGAVEMMLGNESIAKIGNLKNQPYLKELVGGEERILDFMVSSVQNANMLTDMALRNLATKSAVFEMQDLGMAKVGKGTSSGPDVVNFKMNGEDYHAVIDTADAGFPAELLVKGMEGIPYQTTWLTKAMGVPANLLRKAVTLNPVYAARQLFRDSLAAPLLSGADFAPVIGALKQINQPAGKTLERRGITGGQIFTGTQEDLSDTLRRINAGEAGWIKGLAKLEALSMEADALTRRAQYNSYIEQGLSEMEATYAALESMNFSKRGASPAMHFLSTVIPFFNAQVQSLNVLYKAFTGDMPFNEKLKVREKLIKRGAMLASATMLYAVLMQDDETYENATPEQKYGNWFIHVPGFDEAVKLPIPFEIGYIFKALPEALVNMMAKQEGGEEALKAFKQIALQTIPGGSSFGIPQAIKPLIEVGLGKSFYTGRDLESAYEQSLEPGKRVRDKTTDFARVVGDMFNVSPIKIDALIQGYLSSTGLAMVNALSFAIPTPESPERAALRLSETPLVGGLFQPKDAGGILNATYDRMNEAKQVKATFDDLVQKGQQEEARRYLQENLDKYAQAGLATNFTSAMQKLSQAERAIRASSLSPDEKRARLDQIRETKIRIAANVRELASKTTPQ